MKRAKKWIAVLASSAMFITTTGCEMSEIAGTSTEPPNITLTPEEQEELNRLVTEVFGEEAASSLNQGNAQSQETGPAASAEPAVPAASPEPVIEASPEPVKEQTVLEKADALINDPVYALDDNGHGHRSFEEMRAAWRDINGNPLDPFIEELAKYNTENPDDKDAEKTVVKLYQAIIEAYDREYEVAVIGKVLLDEDLSNDELSARIVKADTDLDLLDNKGRTAIRDCLKGPYGDALKEVIDPLQVEGYLSAPDLSERAKELMAEYNELDNEYKVLMEKPVTAEFEGKTYSSEDNEQEFPEDKAAQIRIQLGYARSEQIAPLYTKMIKNRNEYAKELGYRDFIEYAYKSVYGRDYTADDVMKLAASCYESTAGVLTMALLCSGDASMKQEISLDNEAMINTLAANVIKVSPTLKESMDYLQKYKLYSFGSEDVRAPGAYMADLPAARAGCIYIERSNTLADYETLTHEFGHYNNAYHSYSPRLGALNHLDVLETHSQGLEILASTTLNNAFPVSNGDYSAAVTVDLIQSITSALMVAAFEIEAYRNPDRTAQEFCDLLDKYSALCMLGADQVEESGKIGSLWPQIHHIFDCPQYYVSYSISALSALDIYAQYLENPEEAVNKYLDLVNINPNMKYVEAMKTAGLRDMTKVQNINEVMEILNRHYTEEFGNRLVEGVQNGEIGNILTSLLKDLTAN